MSHGAESMTVLQIWNELPHQLRGINFSASLIRRSQLSTTSSPLVFFSLSLTTMEGFSVDTNVSSSGNDKQVARKDCRTSLHTLWHETSVQTSPQTVSFSSPSNARVCGIAYPLQPILEKSTSKTEQPSQRPADTTGHGKSSKSSEEDVSSLVRATNEAVKRNMVSNWAPNTHQILIMATLSLVSLMVALDACVIVTSLNVGAQVLFLGKVLLMSPGHNC